MVCAVNMRYMVHVIPATASSIQLSLACCEWSAPGMSCYAEWGGEPHEGSWQQHYPKAISEAIVDELSCAVGNLGGQSGIVSICSITPDHPALLRTFFTKLLRAKHFASPY